MGWSASATAQYLNNPPPPTDVGAPAGTEILPPWYVVPSFGLGETWTDNVNLSPPGFEQTDIITTISPGLLVNGQTGGLQVSLNFAPQILIFDLGTSSPIFQPNSLGTAHAEIVPEHFFVDGSFSLSQQYLNLSAPVATTTLTSSTNLQTTANVNLSPSLRYRFGDYGDSLTRYLFSYSAVAAGNNANTSINGTPIAPQLYNEISQVFSSGDYYGPGKYTLTGDYNQTSGLSTGNGVSGGTTGSNAYVKFDAVYPIYERLSATGEIGWENFSNTTLTTQPSGFIWNIGLQYNPNQYTSLSFSGGQEYGGTNWAFNANYNPSPNTHFNASYTESITTTQQLLANNVNGLIFGPNGTVINPLTGLPVIPGSGFGTSTINLGLTTGSFLSKEFQLNASATRDRDTYTATVYLNDESQQIQANDTQSLGGTVQWTRQLWPDLTSNLSGSYARVDFQTGPTRTDNYYFINAGLTYTLSQSTSAQLLYTRTDRQSNVALDNLVVDQVTISVTKRF